MNIGYGTRFVISRKDLQRKLILVAAIVASFIYFFAKGTPWFLRKLEVFRLQEALANHLELETQLVYVNFPPTVTSLGPQVHHARLPALAYGPGFQIGVAAGMRPDFAIRVLPEWKRLQDMFFATRPPIAATVFAHERAMNDGTRALVTVNVRRNDDFTLQFQCYAISKETIFHAARVRLSNYSDDQENLPLLHDALDSLELYAGQPDPSDAAKFYIPFTAQYDHFAPTSNPVGGVTITYSREKVVGRIDGALLANDGVSLQVEETARLLKIVSDIKVYHDEVHRKIAAQLNEQNKNNPLQ